MRRLALILLLVLAPSAGAAELTGPAGTSDDKVLVIGTDGTRIDKVRAAIDAGRAPNLKGLRFLVPTRLPYAPPQALTISEVGWSTIASGVGPAKHGVTGFMLNEDPKQATKNGYPDFLSRVESVRPSLSTFVASDWANIARHEHGGPIFGDAIDARFALAAEDTIDSYDAGDQQVTDAAATYLRTGNPDAGFVYLGVVDETAHAVGSATPAYLDAIARTDARIGTLLAAIRARPSFRRERWTVLVTTDHGQQDLSVGSTFSHGGPSDLEETSFVGGTGFGIRSPDAPGVLDIQPTVLTRLGLRVDAAWKLDGKTLFGVAKAPKPRIRGRRKGGRLVVVASAPNGSAPLARVLAGNRSAKGKAGARKIRLAVKAPRGKRVRVAVVDVDGHRTRRTLTA